MLSKNKNDKELKKITGDFYRKIVESKSYKNDRQGAHCLI